MATQNKVQVWIPGESEMLRLIGGTFLGVCMVPTEAEMRTSHIHSKHLQFFGWEVQAAEKNASGDSETTANEWKNHDHLKTIGARLPAPLEYFYCEENALMLLSYTDKTAM